MNRAQILVLLDEYADTFMGYGNSDARAALISAIDVALAQPSHAHAIDTSPERVEKQAGNVQVPGWLPIESAPKDEAVLLAVEFDGPGDWRIKCGWGDERGWHVWGASWKPTHWMPLPAAPSTKEGA